MSKLVLRMQKYGRQDIKGIQIHNQRERPETLKRNNPDYHPEYTQDNWDIVNKEKISYIKRISEIIQSAGYTRKLKADHTMMCEFIVSSDGSFFDRLDDMDGIDLIDKFFLDMLEWFEARYGAGNIVSAVIHYDETTPHMHLCLVPITTKPRNGTNYRRGKREEKDGDGATGASAEPAKPKLSARDLFTPEEMEALQELVWSEVGSKYGLQRGTKGGGSGKEHKSVKDYKAAKTIEKLEAAAAKAAEKIETLEEELATIRGDDVSDPEDDEPEHEGPGL